MKPQSDHCYHEAHVSKLKRLSKGSCVCGSSNFHTVAFFVVLSLFFLFGCEADANRNSPLVVSARLSELLNDPHEDMRRTAALSLGKIAHPTSEQALVKSLKDPDALVREYSAWALGQLGDVVGNSTAVALVGVLGDHQVKVKMAAAQALGRIGPRQSLVDLLREAILIGDTDVRRYAVESLMQLEEVSAYSVLLVALGDSDSGVRQAAVAGLGELGNTKGLPAIRKRLLQDADVGVRTEAAFRLGKLGTRRDLPALKQAGDTDPDPLVHLWSTWAMGNINPSQGSK